MLSVASGQWPAKSILLGMLLLAAMPALMEAQLVTVTASNINDGGQLLPAGTICLAAVGAPATGYHIGSIGQAGECISRDVASGVIMTTLNGVVGNGLQRVEPDPG